MAENSGTCKDQGVLADYVVFGVTHFARLPYRNVAWCGVGGNYILLKVFVCAVKTHSEHFPSNPSGIAYADYHNVGYKQTGAVVYCRTYGVPDYLG